MPNQWVAESFLGCYFFMCYCAEMQPRLVVLGNTAGPGVECVIREMDERSEAEGWYELY